MSRMVPTRQLDYFGAGLSIRSATLVVTRELTYPREHPCTELIVRTAHTRAYTAVLHDAAIKKSTYFLESRPASLLEQMLSVRG